MTTMGRANDTAAELDERRSEYLATLSHELRTPSAVMIGLLRVRVPDTSAGGGLRVGLGIVRRLAEAMGGSVTLGDGDSGARFEVQMPGPGQSGAVADDGRPKVLVFLAHWCPHCQREVPALAAWLEENGPPDDVDIYGIATATSPDRPNYPPSAWLEEEGFTFPPLTDDGDSSTAAAFGLSGFPFFVVLDTEHRVVARASGELEAEQWEDLLDLASSG